MLSNIMGLRGALARNDSVKLVNDEVDIPAPPPDLHPELERQWFEYWTSDVARAADVVDIPLIRRLFCYRDEWHRTNIAYRLLPEDERVVAGSRNADALRMHPFTKRLADLEDMIQKIENQLGLSPLSRARLGIELGQAKLTWAQVQKAAGAPVSSGATALPVGRVEELNP